MYIANEIAGAASGLMYYGADQAGGYRRVAIYVDKILKAPGWPISLSSSRRSLSL